MAFEPLPRRKRKIARIGVLSFAFVAGAVLIVRALSTPTTEYRPGEELEGLTTALARELPGDHPQVSFTDVTADAGIDWRHFGGTRSSQLPEDMGSGAAWGDYDGDGWPDLFLVNISGPLTGPPDRSPEGAEAQIQNETRARSALYRNLGDGTFRDVSAEAGIDHFTTGMAAAWADYDGDGHLDLLVTAYGHITLYRNEGSGTFTDRSTEAHVGAEVGFWTGATWGDYDRDGKPDLYVTGYTRYSPGANVGVSVLQYKVEVPASLNPSSFRPERNLLFHNEGDGTFVELAAAAGVQGIDGRSLSAVWADLDADGWLDLYVANDVSDNALYRNQGDGTFENVSQAALVADYRGAMGLAVGDWDSDGDADLFITHWIAQENALFNSTLSNARDDGRARPLQFLDVADRFGLGQIALDYVGWGTSFFDYDNNGQLDLFVANGSTFQRDDAPHLLEPMDDQLFWNRGPSEGFYDVSSASGSYFGEARVGRGAAFADYDRDGDVDLIVVNHGEAPSLLRNDGGNKAAWLEVVLAGNPVGARVRITVAGDRQVRWLGAQGSYLSQNSPTLHFGLGSATSVDTLEVTWPDGSHDVWTDINGRRAIRLAPRASTIDELWSNAQVDERERTQRFWERFRTAARHRAAGEISEAASAYEDAHALDPTHEDALYYLSGARGELGDFDGALDALNRLIEIDPRSARALVSLGALYSCPTSGMPRDLDQARVAFEAAEEVNPEQVGPALWLGLVALLREDMGEAARRLDAVLGSDPQNTAAIVFRGYVAWKTGTQSEIPSLFARLEDAAAPESEELGLNEGDTRRARSLFASAASCAWVEATLRGFLDRLHVDQDLGRATTTGEEAFLWMEARLADAP